MENKCKRDESTVIFEMHVNSSLEKGFEFCLPLVQRTQNLTIIEQEKHKLKQIHISISMTSRLIM